MFYRFFLGIFRDFFNFNFFGDFRNYYRFVTILLQIYYNFTLLKKKGQDTISSISNSSSNKIYAALRLIESLYTSGKISKVVYKNILNEYSKDIDISQFQCYNNIKQPNKELRTWNNFKINAR